jgi:murein hydrolase activator
MKRSPPRTPVVMALITSVMATDARGQASDRAPPPSLHTQGVAAFPAQPSSAATLQPGGEGSELEQLLARLDAEERALRAEREQIGASIEIAHRRLIARARAHYRHVRAGILPAGGGFDALVDYAATVERTRRALERDQKLEASLLARRSEIDEKLTQIRVMRGPLDLQREAMVRARMALQQADERRAAFARAFESSTRLPDYMAVYGGDSGPSDADSRAGFKALKGRLPLPVSGRAEARRVMRRGAGGPGIELYAMPGAAARSVAPGRVAFADRYDDYGLTVILDHGDHHYSVYGSLRTTDVHAGDTVPQNFRLGAVGDDGTLYFEVRRGAETVDPAPWLGL